MSMLLTASVVLLIGWMTLMLRACFAEYRYYRAVAIHEPEVWVKLGAPSHWLAPFLFLVTPGRKRLLDSVDNPQVLALKRRYTLAGRIFLAYVVVLLLTSIAFFKWA